MRISLYSSIILILNILVGNAQEVQSEKFSYLKGALVRGDSTQPALSLIFTGDQYADGAKHIRKVLKKEQVLASFFFTGNFYSNPKFAGTIKKLRGDGHYLGAHSNKHLLYCDWIQRDSLLVSKEEFKQDLRENYGKMKEFGIEKEDARYFLPPYEWYNDSIAQWTKDMGLILVNMTHGTLSHADYTTPAMENYRASREIFQSIIQYEKQSSTGLNGFLLLIHIGTEASRTDKLYHLLEPLIKDLKKRDYLFQRIDRLLDRH
jgi:peptidoglycan/xylan/chitin deacetylase (PgdA/CDA1 family)